MATTKPQIKIIDCTTGEEIIRDASADEIAIIKERQTRAVFMQAEAEAKAQAKASLLDRLGITQDEANLLLS